MPFASRTLVGPGKHLLHIADRFGRILCCAHSAQYSLLVINGYNWPVYNQVLYQQISRWHGSISYQRRYAAVWWSERQNDKIWAAFASDYEFSHDFAGTCVLKGLGKIPKKWYLLIQNYNFVALALSGILASSTTYICCFIIKTQFQMSIFTCAKYF